MGRRPRAQPRPPAAAAHRYSLKSNFKTHEIKFHLLTNELPQPQPPAAFGLFRMAKADPRREDCQSSVAPRTSCSEMLSTTTRAPPTSITLYHHRRHQRRDAAVRTAQRPYPPPPARGAPGRPRIHHAAHLSVTGSIGDSSSDSEYLYPLHPPLRPPRPRAGQSVTRPPAPRTIRRGARACVRAHQNSNPTCIHTRARGAPARSPVHCDTQLQRAAPCNLFRQFLRPCTSRAHARARAHTHTHTHTHTQRGSSRPARVPAPRPL